MNVKRIITFACVFAIVALTIGLSGCEKIAPMVPDDTTTMPEMMDGEVPIGVAVARTGPFAEPYGLPMHRGFELAREEINMLTDANITFVPADTHSTVEGAVAAVQGLVDQGVPAIVGVGISTQLKEAFPIAQENGVVAFSSISSAAGLSALGDYIFRTGLATNLANPAGVMATQEQLGYTKVAAIYDAADAYSTSSYEEIVKALEASGVEILASETFQTGDTDFSTQLTSIMDMTPEALFISALAPEMVQIIVQAREIGIPNSVHLIVPDLTRDEVQKAGAAAEGAITFTNWSSTSDTPGNQAFVQNYRAKHGIEPEPWAAQSYATLYILANAIANAQSADSAAIRDALAQTMDFPTILGNFSFDPNGEAMYDPIILVAKDGELQAFEAVASQMATPTAIPIGLVVSLTGKNAEPYGLPMQRGFELAREEINTLSDANLVFVPADNQSSEAGTIAAVQQLVDHGVPAIVGIAISDFLEDAFPIAQDSGVVAFSSVSTAAGLSSIGDYVFRAGLAVDRMNPSGVMATHEKLGYTKVALIYDATDTYSTSSNDETKKALEALGVEILIEEAIGKNADYSEELTSIMNMEPDALFVSALSVEMVQVVIQAGELGIPDTIQLIVPDLTDTEIEQIGDAAEGAIAFTGWTRLSNMPMSQAFVQNYQAKYGIEPEPWAAMSYATLYILANAINEAQSVDSAAIRDALAPTMDFPTVLGNFSFDPNGEAIYDATVLMVKDGTLQLFE